jgi:hypothetical protein
MGTRSNKPRPGGGNVTGLLFILEDAMSAETKPPWHVSDEELERAVANPTGLNYWVHQLKDCIRFQLWASLPSMSGNADNQQLSGYGGQLWTMEVRIVKEHELSRETTAKHNVFLLRRLADEIEAKAGKFTDSRSIKD